MRALTHPSRPILVHECQEFLTEISGHSKVPKVSLVIVLRMNWLNQSLQLLTCCRVVFSYFCLSEHYSPFFCGGSGGSKKIHAGLLDSAALVWIGIGQIIFYLEIEWMNTNLIIVTANCHFGRHAENLSITLNYYYTSCDWKRGNNCLPFHMLVPCSRQKEEILGLLLSRMLDRLFW